MTVAYLICLQLDVTRIVHRFSCLGSAGIYATAAHCLLYYNYCIFSRCTLFDQRMGRTDRQLQMNRLTSGMTATGFRWVKQLRGKLKGASHNRERREIGRKSRSSVCTSREPSLGHSYRHFMGWLKHYRRDILEIFEILVPEYPSSEH